MSTVNALQIEMWPLDRVRPYESNPRNNDNAVDAVAASIKEFGFSQPIVVDIHVDPPAYKRHRPVFLKQALRKHNLRKVLWR